MRPEQRSYIVYRLDSTFDWIARSDDWFRRSELATRAISTIVELGYDRDTIFRMDVDYLVTEYKNVRKIRDKLNEAVDEEDPKARFDRIFNFEVWLHEIGLLDENE